MRGRATQGLVLYIRDGVYWIHGTTPDGRKVPRQSTGTRTLEDAELFKQGLIAEYAKPVPKPEGITIREAATLYIASREDEIGHKTSGHYRLLLDRLVEFCEARGVSTMSGLTVDLLERFRVEGLAHLKSTSKSTHWAKLRAFLKAAYKRDWTQGDLLGKLGTVRARYEQKEPYTEEEVSMILDEAGRLNGGTHGYASRPKMFQLLLKLMLDTGMRVGDAIQFDPGACRSEDGVWVYQFEEQKGRKDKAPKLHEVYVSDGLYQEIQESKELWFSRLPFAWGSFANESYLSNEAYARLRTIGKRLKIKDVRPHRFRDTFAVRLLLRGVHLEDVSKLLGHSSIAVTERFYAKWVRARKQRLASIIRDLSETI